MGNVISVIESMTVTRVLLMLVNAEVETVMPTMDVNV